jgi:hypothetical protein
MMLQDSQPSLYLRAAGSNLAQAKTFVQVQVIYEFSDKQKQVGYMCWLPDIPCRF